MADDAGLRLPNLPFWTFGGGQFWADVYVYAGWRIQRNVFTEHHRLLDPGDVRRAWGSYDHCSKVFKNYRVQYNLTPSAPHWVFLLHGLFRSKHSLGRLCSRLEGAGYEPVAVNYPSTQGSVEKHAEQLKNIIKNAEGLNTVSFVTHSLGGIIVRKLFEERKWRKHVSPGRIVMIAPPNRGSRLAELFKDYLPYRVLAGKSGEQLTEKWVKKLPVPDVEIGIIAGQLGEETGWNPLISGPGDGTIGVDATRLDGASDFLKVEEFHSLLPTSKEVGRAVLSFLKNGSFSGAETD